MGVLSQFDNGKMGRNFNKFDGFLFPFPKSKTKKQKISTIWLLFIHT